MTTNGQAIPVMELFSGHGATRGQAFPSWDAAPTAPIPDTVAPVISNLVPTPGIQPGEVGGFPSDFSTARLTPIQFDVVDLDPGIAGIIIMARFNDPDGLVEPTFVVHNGISFLKPFDVASTRTGDLVGGYHYSVIRDTGWPFTSQAPAIHFDVYAIDQDGNVAEEGEET